MAETPNAAAAAATETGLFPLSRTALLGTLTGPDSNVALMRTAAGEVVRLTLGDRIDGATVAAITDGQLHLVRDGRARLYKMPRG